jgi:hypothetical protein
MLALAACAPSPNADAEDYAVWSAAIRTVVAPGKGPISVYAHTGTLDDLRVGPSDLSRWMEREDYERRNRVPVAIDPARLSVANVRVVPDDRASLARQRANAFSHEPRIALSRPGYGLARREAVVTITSSCGDLCGGGETMVLVRGGDGRWRKEATISLIEF